LTLYVELVVVPAEGRHRDHLRLISCPGRRDDQGAVIIVGLFALIDGLVNVIRAFVLWREAAVGWTLAVA